MGVEVRINVAVDGRWACSPWVKDTVQGVFNLKKMDFKRIIID